jgi:signal transduction histidine kinase
MALFISPKKFKAEVYKQTSEACDQILAEMGAELHDDLIQKLSVFRLYIDRLERASADQAEVESLSIKMKSEFESVVHSIRSISRRLLPTPMEDETFDDTIETLCQNMQGPGVGHVHFEHQGICRAIDPKVGMNLFRIIQELIHNAFKHSSAWHIWVRLTWATHHLVIEVEDDGTGFAKVGEFVDRLKRKNNTLKMRTNLIGAKLNYLQGKKGLLARIEISFQ